MNHHQNALEALAQLSHVAGQIDTAECKDEGLYNRLQSALAVANASLDDAMKAMAAAPQVVADEADLECQVPPFGWRCTRGAGHPGPCAAVECPEDVAAVELGVSRLAAAPMQAQEPVYQVSQPFPADPENTWRDASSDAYDMSHPDRRRILYSAPVQPVAVPDGWRDAALESAVQAVVERAGESEKIDVINAFDAIRSLKKNRHALPESCSSFAAPAAQGDAKERECCGSSEFCERDTCPTQDGEHAEFYRHIRDEVIGDDPEAIGMGKAKKPGLDAACRAAIAAKAAS